MGEPDHIDLSMSVHQKDSYPTDLKTNEEASAVQHTKEVAKLTKARQDQRDSVTNIQEGIVPEVDRKQEEKLDSNIDDDTDIPTIVNVQKTDAEDVTSLLITSLNNEKVDVKGVSGSTDGFEKSVGAAESVIVEQPKKKPNPNKSLWKGTTSQQKQTLLLVIIANFSVYFCVSLPGTFMARVVMDRSGTAFYAAAVMQANQVATAVASLICGKFQYRIGCKRCLISGLFVFTLCQASHGILQYVHDMTTFVILGILIRIVLGISLGFICVSSLTLLWQTLPDCIEKAYGFNLSAVGIGFLAGPVVGSVLYSIQDEMLIPFLVSAALPFLLFILGYLRLKEITVSKSESSLQVLKYIVKPLPVLVIGLLSAMHGTLSLYDVIFTTYMEGMGVNVLQVGSIMLCGDAVFTVSSIAGGYLSSLETRKREILFFISLLGFLGILFSFVDDQPVGWVYLEVAVFALFSALIVTAAFALAMQFAIRGQKELKTSFQFQSKFSGVWGFVTSCAGLILPLLGSSLHSTYSYRISLVVCYVIGIVIGIAASVIVFLINKFKCCETCFNS